MVNEEEDEVVDEEKDDEEWKLTTRCMKLTT